MKCALGKVMRFATRARINGVDWIVVPGDEAVVLRRPSVDRDPRVCYYQMTFGAAQDVQLKQGCVTAYRSDTKVAEHVTMWLFREVGVTSDDFIKTA